MNCDVFLRMTLHSPQEVVPSFTYLFTSEAIMGASEKQEAG